MTALAVALVLCCAMVCGTLLRILRARAQMAEVDTLAADVARVEAALKAAGALDAEMKAEIASARSDLESLRAQVALRSV